MTELVPIARLLGEIFREGPTVAALEGACRACVEALPVSGAAISMLPGTARAQTLCASDGAARMLEELQFTLGAGPCVDAYRADGPVLADDLTDPAADPMWPTFASRATEAGIHAVAALPLHLGAIRLGVLGLYRDRSGALPLPAIGEALLAADVICVALVDLLHDRRGPYANGSIGRPAEQIALDHAEVHQATGILMARLGVSAADALSRLRGYAFVHDMLLTDVADALIADRIELESD